MRHVHHWILEGTEQINEPTELDMYDKIDGVCKCGETRTFRPFTHRQEAEGFYRRTKATA